MMKFKKICYVFPETKNFREERPRLCYEHMYGWIDGYGVLFDPVIRSHYEEIPAFSNGVPAKLEEDTFFITASPSEIKVNHYNFNLFQVKTQCFIAHSL